MDSAERADYRISIHAPRTGSDLSRNAFWICAKNFNPRSPHGERQTGSENHLRDTTFQSTLPARGATGANVGNMRTSKKFQSTLPARGATRSSGSPRHSARNFNPRSPHGERPEYDALTDEQRSISIHAPRTGSDDRHCRPRRPACPISIHAPRTGSDGHLNRVGLRLLISIHAPRTGSDGAGQRRHSQGADFNPRSPHGERHS